MLLRVLETNHRIAVYKIAWARVSPVSLLGGPGRRIFFLWIESALWATIRRLGRRSDRAVLVGLHLALVLGRGGRVRVPVDANEWAVTAR